MIKTACLILAAGEASRFGSPKQLAEIAGKSLLTWAVTHTQSAGFSPILVVSGAHRAAVEQQLPSTVAHLHHAAWAQGMQSTIRWGLQELLRSADWTHCCILPADMPYFDAFWLKAYQAAFALQPSELFLNGLLSEQVDEVAGTMCPYGLTGYRFARPCGPVRAQAGSRLVAGGKGSLVAQDGWILANKLSDRPAFPNPSQQYVEEASPTVVATLYARPQGAKVQAGEPGLPLVLNRMLAEAVVKLPLAQPLRPFWLQQRGLVGFPTGPHTHDIDRVEDIK